jgi:hypothetical protein
MRKKRNILYSLMIAIFLLSFSEMGYSGIWSVVESGEELRLHYGSNGNFPQ